MRRYACLPEASVTNGRFSLTTIQDAHIESIRTWRNAQMEVLRQSTPISAEQQRAYFNERIWPTLTDPMPANLLLTYLDGETPNGYGGLVHISWEHRRAEVSFLLDPVHTTDIATYARHFSTYLGLLKQLAFDGLGFHRLFTETYAIRTDHIRALEANGFRPEGRMRDHVVIAGVAVDSLIHGCLHDER